MITEMLSRATPTAIRIDDTIAASLLSIHDCRGMRHWETYNWLPASRRQLDLILGISAQAGLSGPQYLYSVLFSCICCRPGLLFSFKHQTFRVHNTAASEVAILPHRLYQCPCGFRWKASTWTWKKTSAPVTV
jgi:hypothetical protein